MNEPWFSDSWAWLPGTLLGCLAGLIGGLTGWLAPQGKAKPFILGATWFLFVASVVMLCAGALALAVGQPYGVWYGLGLAGVIGVIVIGVNLPGIARAYRMAEERRMTAEDLR
jgi:hypothetical protein